MAAVLSLAAIIAGVGLLLGPPAALIAGGTLALVSLVAFKRGSA